MQEPLARGRSDVSTALIESVRGALERRLAALWFGEGRGASERALAMLLAPLATLAGSVARRRRDRIRRLAPAHRPAVIVVGNLLAGGTGKTPATIALARALSARGLRVGLIARGYRARRSDARIVAPAASAAEHGDEPVLLARETGLPVAAGHARDEALRVLEEHHPGLDVVISDDGLQHAALPRTIEIAVFDARGAGNGRLLPAGPLREPLAHLAGMDAVLLNGDARAPAEAPRAFRFDVAAAAFRSVRTGRTIAADDFASFVAGRDVDALAAIAQPRRFFAMLSGLGVHARPHPLSDHATIESGLLTRCRAPLIVMTSKDAVKCAAFADDRCWALEVRARLDPAFLSWIEERLRGPSTA